MALEFQFGEVRTAYLKQTSRDGLRGYGFIEPDLIGAEEVWFGSGAISGAAMLLKGDRVKYARASSRSKGGKLAASIVELLE